MTTTVVDMPYALGARFGIDVLDSARLRRAPSSDRLMDEAERALADAASAPAAAVWCLKEAAVKANGGRASLWSLDDLRVTSLRTGPCRGAPLAGIGAALAELVGGEPGTATVAGREGGTYLCSWTEAGGVVAAVAVDATGLDTGLDEEERRA